MVVNDSKLISVCMITYKHQEYIREAIEGVLIQKCNFKIELIIADDNSPDNTKEIIDEVCIHNKSAIDIKYTRHSENKGMVKNFIWSMQQAKGEYIALCEGDDYWTDPNKLQKQLEFLENNESVVIAFHKVLIYNQYSKSISEKIFNIKFEDIDAEELLKAKKYIPTNSLFFRNVIFKYPKEFLNVLNTDTFLLSMLGNYGGAAMIKSIEPSVYRIHTGGVWSTKSDLIKAINHKNTIKNLSKYHKKIGNTDLSKYFNELIKTSLNQKIYYHSIKNKSIKFALKYFVISMFSHIKNKNYKQIFINIKSIIKLGIH